MARDAGETLEGAIGPLVPYVDEIVVLLGGESTDNTEEIARKYTDKVFPFEWCDDFSAARNALFSHCTSDWIFWIDADDVVEKPELLRELAADADAKDWGTVQLPYLYAFDENGNCIVKHDQHRLMRRDLNWQWGCSCRQHSARLHEVCFSDIPHTIAFDQRITVVHQRLYVHENVTDQGPRNFRLLQMMEKEAPKCRRTRLAMAHCLFGMLKWEAALFYFQAYYQEPESQLEQWHSCCFAAKCCWNLQRWPEMANWAAIAIDMQPEIKDGYLLRAHADWWGKQDATRALTWIFNANDKIDAPPAVFVTPTDYTLNRWDIEHRCYHALGMDDKALQVIEKALKIAPENLILQFYHRLYVESVRSDKSIRATIQLVDHLVRVGDTLKARELARHYLPHNIEGDPRIGTVRGRLEKMNAHLDDPDKYRELYESVDHEVVPLQISEVDGVTYATADFSLWARFAFVEERFEKLRPKRVLDIACGNGLFDIELALKFGCEVTAIDISRHAIEDAKRYLRKQPKEVRKLVKFVCGDPLLMPMEKFGKFDVVLLLEILEHTAGPQAQRLMGVVENVSGRFIATVPAEVCIEGPGIEADHARMHVRHFSMGELAELIGKRQDRRVINLFKKRDHTANLIPGFGTWAVEWDMKNLDMPRIVFYLGHGPEDWEPGWVNEGGLGGSETAAIKMAEEFAAVGFAVVVYAGYEGVVNGVAYQFAERFNPQLPFMGVLPAFLMVGSRIPEAAAYVNAQHRWLWMHDTDCQDRLTPENAERIDRVVVLSQWHAEHVRKTYPFLKPEQILVSGDGLHTWVDDVVALTTPIDTQRHRFIYASSPDRGLDVLLTWWPGILKKWKDAELHVFYGWKNYDQMMEAYPEMAPFKEKVMRLMKQPQVFDHGRVGQKELAEEFAKSQFWLYPSIRADGQDWHETYCIAAMEAQANGCIPVTRPVGALAERCVDKHSLVDSRNPKHFMKRLHWWDTRKDSELTEMILAMLEGARKSTWERVAIQWLAVLNADERARLELTALADEKEVPCYV